MAMRGGCFLPSAHVELAVLFCLREDFQCVNFPLFLLVGRQLDISFECCSVIKHLDFLGGASGKESACNADLGLIPGLR